jgi:O-antigen/teichoic acid export membrane protein
MNTIQRLLSNTALALVANVIIKASTSILFILIGRILGPTESGVFSLGTTYFTIVFGLSALGLHELLVREVAPRHEESARYFVNYLALRLVFSMSFYLLLLMGLRLFQPYSPETERVILILALAALPEAVFTICGALFEAHETLAAPTLAAVINSLVKIAGGFWLLRWGASVDDIAWLMVAAGVISLLVFPPALVRLFRRTPQRGRAVPDPAFGLAQLRQTPGFFAIHLFSVLDYQTDAFLISLMLTETDLGYYSAALTITLAISLMTFAIRAAIYPVMSRYAREAPDKLALLHAKANQYLIALALPIAAAVCLLARPIIRLIYGEAFAPAAPVLQVSIWAAVFLLVNVPNARLLLVDNRQAAAAGLTAVSMSVNVVANLILIPLFGIVGAATARVVASAAFFLSIHLYVRANILRSRFLPLLPRPLLATALMVAAMWPAREWPMIVPLLIGAGVYAGAALLLRVVPAGDLVYWRQVLRRRTGEGIERG